MSQDTIDSDVWSAVVAQFSIMPSLSLIAVRCSLLGRNTLSSRCYQERKLLPNIKYKIYVTHIVMCFQTY